MRVSLSPDAYKALCRADGAVLAPGHPLETSRRTRRRAKEVVEEARAVTAQAAHQVRRARRNSAVARKSVRGRVLVVDDSHAFRQAAAAIVSSARDLRLVGAAFSGEEAIRLLPDLKPDFVLLDCRMPGMSGVETAHIIRRNMPDVVVVLVSAEPETLAVAARDVGAVALLDKRGLRGHTLDELWLTHMSRS